MKPRSKWQMVESLREVQRHTASALAVLEAVPSPSDSVIVRIEQIVDKYENEMRRVEQGECSKDDTSVACDQRAWSVAVDCLHIAQEGSPSLDLSQIRQEVLDEVARDIEAACPGVGARAVKYIREYDLPPEKKTT